MLLRAHRSDRPESADLSPPAANPARLVAPTEARPIVRLDGVSVVRDGRAILDSVDWTVSSGERWVLLGPNGSGKTTLLHVAGARLWPTNGQVEVLGERIGRVDMRVLRSRVALTSGAVIRQLRPDLTAREIVVTGLHGALEPWWHRYSAEEWAEADRLLARMKSDALAPTSVAKAESPVVDPGAARTIGSTPFSMLSEGERQQVLLSRALIGRPELLLLDEPAAGLDLGAREQLIVNLAELAASPESPPLVLVTHHLEEIPFGATHAALMRRGRLVASGSIEEVLTGPSVSACFGTAVEVGCSSGRWWARAES